MESTAIIQPDQRPRYIEYFFKITVDNNKSHNFQHKPGPPPQPTRMRRPLIATCLVLVTTATTLFSQSLPKTFLWRISGNGLSRPSYLFGTIHLTDPRLFALGDSLLNAISSSEGFANELDLNQITPMVTEMVRQQITHSVTVKDLISKKTFDQYAPALAKKFNKPAGEITTADILNEKNKWINEAGKGKKMQTFLDAYLMDLANRQGKWIGGVEDFADQSGLLNSLVDESDIRQMALGNGSAEKTGIDRLTGIYLDGDLEGLDRYMNGMDSTVRDRLLIHRNHKMAFRMDSLAHIRSVVFAVGAAHLPGEEGLIRLLRARGYTVDPVFSSKKIKPEDYTVREVARPWVAVNDPAGRYKVMMPGEPGNIRLYGILSMEMYYDIFNGTVYMTYSIPEPYSGKGLDSAENAMLKQMFGGPDYKREKALEINGIPGQSFIQKNSSGYKKVYLLNKGNILYLAAGFSSSDAENSLQALNRFFDSYQPVFTQSAETANNYAYFDSLHFYRILLPSKPSPVDNFTSPDKTLNAVLMISADAQTGSYYFCGCNECKEGYAFENDSTVMGIAHGNLIKKYNDLTLDTVYAENNRRILEMDGSMMKGAMRARTKMILRGNRDYTVLIMYAPGKWNGRMEQALQSFQLADYPAGHWANASTPDSLFTTWAPNGFVYSAGKDSGEFLQFPHYECLDSSRAHIYLMRIDTLDKYFWKKNDSLFWAFERNRFVTDSDTLLSERMFSKDGLFQYEFLCRPRGANNIMRMHMWLRGNLVYRMTTIQEPETIGDENVNRFFDQFHFNRSAEKSHVFESKATLLLQDLRSADTLISRKANRALATASFDATEIPLLQEAVLIHYPEDDGITNSPNGQIAERMIRLNDSASVIFAREHFAAASDGETENALLDILSAWHKASNYDNLGRLLLTSPPKYALAKWVTAKWQDSLQIAVHLFPTVLPLLKDSLLAPAIFDLANSLLGDSLITMDIFHPWQQAMLQYAGRRFRKTLADTLYYTPSDYSVISLLQRMKTDSCNAMLNKWLGVTGNVYHKQEIVLSLLKNNRPVSHSVLNELAADEFTRLDLYRNLSTYKKIALFPAKYLTQPFFAESLAREAAGQFSDAECNIKFLRAKEMKWQGALRRFFFYDLGFEDDGEHWLAVAGPYNINDKGISFSASESRVYVAAQYDPQSADQQMAALVREMSEDK